MVDSAFEKNQELYAKNIFVANRQSPRRPNISPTLFPNTSNQLPPSPYPSPGAGVSKERARTQHEGLISGFTTITVAGAFIAAIQAQIMGSATSSDQTIADRAVNAFYIGGLILDVMSACLAFLTTRWLERLTESEKDLLEKEFSCRPSNLDEEGHDDKGGPSPFPPERRSWQDTMFYTWLGISLFVPMPLLIFGIVCMLAGIYTNVWAQHSAAVAGMVTLAGAATLPFVVGIFFIGRKKRRRAELIIRLSEMQGDW
ncbi:hypothetical protein F5148DRAFT_526942 [Russula earlei]|uniref:Uncharacterized protein n=1 Tax=Russula earlei TaxID=71964 RepID=A0ACC0TXW3_9AGAM|nr:hypothetical protein F5148DRAFT_526942 [Russula earlei]